MIWVVFLPVTHAQLINLTDVLTNQTLWITSGITDYDMTFLWNCYCGGVCNSLWKLIEVKNRNVSEVSYDNPSKAANQSCVGLYLEREDYVSVDDMFDILIAKVPTAEETHGIFDAKLGYPSYVVIDEASMIAGEETSWIISSLLCMFI